MVQYNKFYRNLKASTTSNYEEQAFHHFLILFLRKTKNKSCTSSSPELVLWDFTWTNKETPTTEAFKKYGDESPGARGWE